MIKALLIDDDLDILTVAEMCLELDGEFLVKTANSGREGIAKAQEWRPNVILLDYMMPEMDGEATLLELKCNEATTDIPVVFVTAKNMKEDKPLLRMLGAKGVLSKPFDPGTLAQEVKQLLPT